MDMSIGYYLETPAAAGGRFGASNDDDGDDGSDRGTVLRDCLTANYHRLHRRLLRHLGCPDQASDCLHDAWLRLGETRVSATVQNPEAYIYRVACNVAIDRLRGNRWQQCGGVVDIIELEQIVDDTPGPDVIAEARSSLETIARAMDRLPRLHSAVLIALRINELSRQEVANRYGLSLRAVDTALRRALECCARAA